MGGHFLRAQDAEQDTKPISPQIISTNTVEDLSKRNAWQREYVVEKEIEYYDEHTDQTVRETIKSSIVEVGSGLNYLDGDEWKPANPHFVQTPNGFELVECVYKVRFGRMLWDMMYYEIDDVTIPMRIEYVIISDGTNQRTLSPSANVFGSIDANDPSALHFADAINNINITYRAHKGGFHQDIKIKNLNALSFDGLNNEQAKAYIYTIINDSAFVIDSVSIKIADTDINTGADEFRITDEIRNDQIQFNIADGDNRKNLFSFDPSLILDAQGKESGMALRQLWRNPANGSLYLVESVALNALQNGSIIDYQTVSGNITSPTTWTANNTYYVSNDINLSDQLSIEPGTVIKFASGKSLNVNSGGKIIAEGEPWNYIIFTAQGDSSCGESLGGPTPSPGFYSRAIDINYGSTQSIIRYCKIAYANVGIEVQSCNLAEPIRDNIIYKCNTGINFLNNAQTQVINNLITECPTYGINVSGLEGTYEFYSNTIDQCGTCIYVFGDDYCPTVNIKDTIISNWTNYGIAVGISPIMNVDYISYYPINNPDTWKSSGFSAGNNINGLNSSPYDGDSIIGNYYLNSNYASNASYDGEAEAQDRGFDNGKYTYIKPQAYDSGSSTIDEDTTWSKQSDPQYQSTTQVKRGYHHNRVDYLINDIDLSVTDGTLTTEPGVVTAIYYASGDTNRKIYVKADGGTSGRINCSGINSAGIEECPIIASKRQLSMLVETPLITSATQDRLTGIRLSGTETDNIISHTKFVGFHNAIFIDKASSFEVTDCIFAACDKGIATGGYDIKTRNHLFYYTNNGIYVNSATSGKTHEFYNLTCDRASVGNGVFLNAWSGDTVRIYDTLFSNLNYGIKYNSYVGTIETDYCRYYKTTYNISSSFAIGDNSVDLGDDAEDTPYNTAATAIADRWFLDQSKTGEDGCVNSGSRDAYTARMSAHTTNYGEYLTDTGIADIGYHYWVFKDDDHDGMNDYWEAEDANNADDPEADLDGDMLTNLEEYQIGTDPWNWDTDGDTLADGWETQNHAVTGALDPLATDADNDGINDPDEDYDEDELTNLQEQEHGTDPNKEDTDFDGVYDATEITAGTNPNSGGFSLTYIYPPCDSTIFVSEPFIEVKGTASENLKSATIYIRRDTWTNYVPAKVNGKDFNVRIPLCESTRSNPVKISVVLIEKPSYDSETGLIRSRAITTVHKPAKVIYEKDFYVSFSEPNPRENSIFTDNKYSYFSITVNLGGDVSYEVTLKSVIFEGPENITAVPVNCSVWYGDNKAQRVLTIHPLNFQNGENVITITAVTHKEGDPEDLDSYFMISYKVYYCPFFIKREYIKETLNFNYGGSEASTLKWFVKQEKEWNKKWFDNNPFVPPTSDSFGRVMWPSPNINAKTILDCDTHTIIVKPDHTIDSQLWSRTTLWSVSNENSSCLHFEKYRKPVEEDNDPPNTLPLWAANIYWCYNHFEQHTEPNIGIFLTHPMPYDNFGGKFIIMDNGASKFAGTNDDDYSIMGGKRHAAHIDLGGDEQQADFFASAYLSPLTEYEMEVTRPESEDNEFYFDARFWYAKPLYVHIDDVHDFTGGSIMWSSAMTNVIVAHPTQSHTVDLNARVSPGRNNGEEDVNFELLTIGLPTGLVTLDSDNGQLTLAAANSQAWGATDSYNIEIKATYRFPYKDTIYDYEDAEDTIKLKITRDCHILEIEAYELLEKGEHAPVYATLALYSEGNWITTNNYTVTFQIVDDDGEEPDPGDPCTVLGYNGYPHPLCFPDVSPLYTQGVVAKKGGKAWIRALATNKTNPNDQITSRWVNITVWHIEFLQGSIKTITDNLRVAKWVDAFEGTYPNITVKDDFIDEDPHQFYVRVYDTSKKGEGSVNINLWTDSPIAVYSDSKTIIQLTETGEDTGIFESKSMMLMSDDVDDDYEVDSIADNAQNDRTFKVALGGTVLAEYNMEGFTAIKKADVPFPPYLKEVNVNLVIVRDRAESEEGNAPVSVADVINDWKIARERYAQVGVRINWTGPVIVDPPAGVNFDDGFRSHWPILTSHELTTEAKSLIEGCGTVPDDTDIHVFYVSKLEGLLGVAIAHYWFLNENGYLYNIFIRHDKTAFVAAHELTHLLADWGYGTNVPQTNLMNEDSSLLTAGNVVTGLKRLNQSQTNSIRLNSHLKKLK